MIDVNYDKENGVLYLGFADQNNSYGAEETDNVILLRDIDTEEITGVTVLLSCNTRG